MEKIILPHQSVLHKVNSNHQHNWILIPGGPGMGPEYLIKLAKQLTVPVNFYVFDFPNYQGKYSDNEVIAFWKLDLLESAKIVKKPILFGHSFGAMFCLGIPELREYISAMILSDGSPNQSYRLEYAKEWKRVGTKEMDLKEDIFKKASTEDNLKNLFYSWAPFFFVDPVSSLNRNIIFENSYNVESFTVGMSCYMKNFENKWDNFDIPLWLISGEYDRITPLHLYRNIKEFQSARYIQIPYAGHFPWMENLQEFNQELLKIDKSLKFTST